MSSCFRSRILCGVHISILNFMIDVVLFRYDGLSGLMASSLNLFQEEMDRKNGYWWSPDNTCIAFTEVDSSEIPLYKIMHQGKSTVGSEAQEDHAYPFARASNVKVRLGVVPVIGGPVTWMDLSCGGDRNTDDEYLA